MGEKISGHNHLNILIERKKSRLPETARILAPQEIDPSIAAGAMEEILSLVYGKHNLTPTVEVLTNQIHSGQILPWFIKDQDRFVTCAALIVGQNSVEIGRAANHPEFGHNGSLLMLSTVVFHRQNFPSLPLVAEIRLANQFQNIPGGQGSQATLIKNAGMKPHAVIPAFHHPGPSGPDRQEFFCFSTDRRPGNPGPIILSKALLGHPIITTLLKSFFPLTEVIPATGQPTRTGFWLDSKSPFNVLRLDPGGSGLQEELTKTQKPFTIAPLPLTPEGVFASELLLENGFLPCGFDQGETPTLLMGQLKAGTILAPIGLASECFDQETTEAILILEQEFRRRI